MFKEFVEKKHYSFHEGFDDWRDAVRAACAPLLADGTMGQMMEPVVLPDPVEIDNTIVERASLHNMTFIKDLKFSSEYYRTNDLDGYIYYVTPGAATYAEFAANGGYLVAPEGAVAVNIPMYSDSNENELSKKHEKEAD